MVQSAACWIHTTSQVFVLNVSTTVNLNISGLKRKSDDAKKIWYGKTKTSFKSAKSFHWTNDWNNICMCIIWSPKAVEWRSVSRHHIARCNILQHGRWSLRFWNGGQSKCTASVAFINLDPILVSPDAWDGRLSPPIGQFSLKQPTNPNDRNWIAAHFICLVCLVRHSYSNSHMVGNRWTSFFLHFYFYIFCGNYGTVSFMSCHVINVMSSIASHLCVYIIFFLRFSPNSH